MAKKRNKLGRFVSTIQAGNARVNIHGKSKAQCRRNATNFVTHYMKNVEGFRDATGFHPIRGGKGYKKSIVKRAVAKKRTRKARPMH